MSELCIYHQDKSKLQSYVIASGLQYGQGENVFHLMFKVSFHCSFCCWLSEFSSAIHVFVFRLLGLDLNLVSRSLEMARMLFLPFTYKTLPGINPLTTHTTLCTCKHSSKFVVCKPLLQACKPVAAVQDVVCIYIYLCMRVLSYTLAPSFDTMRMSSPCFRVFVM